MELNNSEEAANCLTNVSRKRKKEQEEEKENVVTEVFTDYCTSTSIHGMGYLGAKDKSLPEKIWWVIVIIISFICCSYLISQTWNKWKTNPVILSFEQEQTAVWEIPFPAVTLCPVSKVMQTTYNYTQMFRHRDELVGEAYKKFWDISLMCNIEQYDDTLKSTINNTDETAIRYMREVACPIHGLFFDITWQGEDYEVQDKLFTEHLTKEGICYTFNSFSQEDMYTKQLNHDIVYINHTIKNVGWTLENGYPPDSTILNNHPRRAAKDGSGSGLHITLNDFTENRDFVCGSPISGYKIILHNPAEIPTPSEQYYLFPLEKQVTFIVKPELTTTSKNLRSLSSSSRKCYFSNEKLLRFFNVYTQSNCRIECAVNITQHSCGCVPFYLPHDKNTPICGFGRMPCIEETEIKVLNFEMIEKTKSPNEVKKTEIYKIFDKCNCLPSCSNLQYSAETSQTDFHPVQSFFITGLQDNDEDFDEDLKKKLQEGQLKMTQVDIFFKESQFLALHRSELYGHTDFLANCGGLLGLFMGFSILSLLEIFYFAIIRLSIRIKNRKRE